MRYSYVIKNGLKVLDFVYTIDKKKYSDIAKEHRRPHKKIKNMEGDSIFFIL